MLYGQHSQHKTENAIHKHTPNIEHSVLHRQHTKHKTERDIPTTHKT